MLPFTRGAVDRDRYSINIVIVQSLTSFVGEAFKKPSLVSVDSGIDFSERADVVEKPTGTRYAISCGTVSDPVMTCETFPLLLARVSAGKIVHSKSHPTTSKAVHIAVDVNRSGHIFTHNPVVATHVQAFWIHSEYLGTRFPWIRRGRPIEAHGCCHFKHKKEDGHHFKLVNHRHHGLILYRTSSNQIDTAAACTTSMHARDIEAGPRLTPYFYYLYPVIVTYCNNF